MSVTAPAGSAPLPRVTGLTVHDLQAQGKDYIRRACEVMEHARKSRDGGKTYVPLAETPAECAGRYILGAGSARSGLGMLNYDIAHVGGHENGKLWIEAREILRAAMAAVPQYQQPTSRSAPGARAR